eukprot:133582_1
MIHIYHQYIITQKMRKLKQYVNLLHRAGLDYMIQILRALFLWSDLSPLDYGIPIGLGSGPWSAGNPDNYGTGEHCIHLIADSGWNDVPCSSQQHSLCNYPTLIYVFNDNKNYQRMPVASNIIGIMDILDEIYIEFKININSFISDSGYSNILHIG